MFLKMKKVICTQQLSTGCLLCDVYLGDEADEAQLLAAALKEDEEPEDNSVTAI